MSFDATYSMVTSALSDMQTDRLDTWRLVETDYGRGIITVEAGGYWTQERKVRFLIERLAPFRTKVELNGKWATPFTQKFFKAMDKRYAEQALTHPT